MQVCLHAGVYAHEVQLSVGSKRERGSESGRGREGDGKKGREEERKRGRQEERERGRGREGRKREGGRERDREERVFIRKETVYQETMQDIVVWPSAR